MCVCTLILHVCMELLSISLYYTTNKYTDYFTYKSRQAKNIEEDAQKNLGRKTSHKKFILNIKAPILANPMHVAQPSSSANEYKKRSEV